MALLDNLVSHWKLDETSGTRNDSYGTNHLTNNNSVTSAIGKIGNAADFELSSSQWLSKTSPVNLSLGDADFTVCAWVKLESNSTVQDILGKWNANSNQREYALLYRNTTDRFEFSVSSNGTSTQQIVANNFGSPSLDTWYFVVAWHDAVNNLICIQINNGSINSTSYSSGVFQGSSAFGIGLRGGSTLYWDGLIDSVSFWKRILTSEERSFLYNDGRGLDYFNFKDYNYLNFAVANVSTLYSANAGVIDLSTNHGLKLPSAKKPFYAVWWNYTDYPDPTDDPNKEVVKVYKKINDKLFIQRGCQGTAPSDKNLIGKTYKIAQFFDEDKFNKQLFYFKNPQYGFYYYNEFENGVASGTNIDSFTQKAGGTGGTRTATTSLLNRPGIITISGGSTATTAGQGLMLGHALFLLLGHYDIEATWWLKINENTDFMMGVGFDDNLNTLGLDTTGSNSIKILRTETDPNWFIRIENTSVQTLRETLPVRADYGKWYEIKLKTFKENILEVYINKTLIKRYLNLLPLDFALSPFMAIVNEGTLDNSFDLDAFEIKVKFRNERTRETLN